MYFKEIAFNYFFKVDSIDLVLIKSALNFKLKSIAKLLFLWLQLKLTF